ASIPSRPKATSPAVSPEALVEESRAFCRGLVGPSDPSRVRVRWAAESFRRGEGGASLAERVRRLGALARLEVAPTSVYVVDHAQSYDFHPVRGLEKSSVPRARCDVAVSSSALSYAFKFPWGGQSLF